VSDTPRAWDAHCHADLFDEPTSVARECDSARVAVLAVTTTPRAFVPNQRLFAKYPNIRVALGIHPELAASKEADLALFSSLLSETKFIGEVGLDGRPQHWRTLPVQRELLRAILRLCHNQNKVFSLHSPRAVKELLDEIENCIPDPDTVKILHWFTGTKSEAQRAIELGCYFSVNHAMLSKATNHAIIQSLPIERVLTETDGPFVKVDGRPSRPPDVLIAAEMLARLWGTPADVAERQLLANASFLFQN
jgi:TatD DNase family protein